jgi:hypothetical protein
VNADYAMRPEFNKQLNQDTFRLGSQTLQDSGAICRDTVMVWLPPP